jgi:hypothetical protein
MAAPLPPHSQASLELAQRLIREAAIQGLRPEFFLVDVVGAVIAVIQHSRGAACAEAVARGASNGCLEIVGVIRKAGGS